MDEWVNCYDRLPEMYDTEWNNVRYSFDVLIYTSSQEYYLGYFEYLKDGTVFFRPNRHGYPTVNDGWQVTHETYWRELPAPPKIKE